MMIMVNLTAVCQYPQIKKIGKDSVVIMKVTQAEDINKRFLSMRDSINYINLSIEALINKHNLLVIQSKDSIDKLNKKNILLGGEANWYKKEYYEVERNTNKYLSEVNTSMKILIGITAVLTSLVTILMK